MLERTFTLATALALVALAGHAVADKVPVPKISKEGKGTWRPLVFEYGVERFPAGYSGNAPQKFVDLFKSKIVEVKKEEFETFDEYAARLSRTERILPPLNRTDSYAFSFDNLPVGSYSADSSAYFPGSSYPPMCRASKIDNWVTCRNAVLGKLSKKYVGTNAFGASVNVTDDFVQYFSLALRTDSSFVQSMLRKSGGNFVFGDRLEIDIAKAKLLKEKHISVLIVGTLADHMMIPAQIDRLKAEFSAPADYLATEEAVPITVRALYYYVKETGEILKSEKFE